MDHNAKQLAGLLAGKSVKEMLDITGIGVAIVAITEASAGIGAKANLAPGSVCAALRAVAEEIEALSGCNSESVRLLAEYRKLEKDFNARTQS